MRYGNKSVISIIRDNHDENEEDEFKIRVAAEDEMPMLKDGRRVDLMVNALSAFNRNISFALYEPCINAIFDRFLAHIKNWKVDDQFDFVMNAIGIISKNYKSDLLTAMKKTNMSKKQFVDSIYREGVYIRIEPFVDTLTLRDSLVELYRTYPDILKSEPLLVWYPPRQQYIETILPSLVGDTYVMVLKQDGVNAASARGAGGVSPEGLPIKSNNKANYMSDISDTAVKLGE